ncbi:hypothetical protein K5V06_14845 [Empedobacter falsenii]|nr:hypothetical protein [Empedobacter falsenii]
MKAEIKTADIFQRLRNGETIPPNDPEEYKMIEACNLTKKLLVEMNNAT